MQISCGDRSCRFHTRPHSLDPIVTWAPIILTNKYLTARLPSAYIWDKTLAEKFKFMVYSTVSETHAKKLFELFEYRKLLLCFIIEYQ